VIDFGVAKLADASFAEGGDGRTVRGELLGTPEYMAPEQAQGHAQPGPTTDLYSLGVVAYEMLSGAPPFEGDTPFSVVVKHIKEPPAPLVERVPGVSRALHDVVLRALEKEPQLRYATADQMREALEAASAPQPSPAAEAFVVDQPTPRPHALPVPGVLPPGVPMPPPQLGRPSVIPSPIAAVPTPTPPPPSPRVPAPGAVRVARPAVPVPPRAQVHGSAAPASDAAIVDDRPGHYRSLMTAKATKSPQATRPAWLPAAIVGALALLGIIGLAVAMAMRETPSP
jgi:serine/threonine-protein kinase